MPNSLKYHYQLDDRVVATKDSVVTGRDIREAVGSVPPSELVLVRLVDRASRSVDLDEQVELSENGSMPEFRSFQNDRVYTLTVNERGCVWGAENISVSDIRRLGRIPDDHEVILDSDGDRVLGDDKEVRLGEKGVERIRTSLPTEICIYVNTREKLVVPGKISFDEVCDLAFPGLPPSNQTTRTIKYTKGCREAPEGFLTSGESVKVKRGMEFNVSSTDKS